MTAQPGERMLSWLDEDDPNRGSVPYVPVESVIDLTPDADEPPPRKKSRREKAPKAPKPPRAKRWRRDKATQEKPPRENPTGDVTPRADNWPPKASEDWLTSLRRPAAAPVEEPPPPAAPAKGAREDWFTPREAPPAGSREAAFGPSREASAAPSRETAFAPSREAPTASSRETPFAASREAAPAPAWEPTPPMAWEPPAPSGRDGSGSGRSGWDTPDRDDPRWADTPPDRDSRWDSAPAGTDRRSAPDESTWDSGRKEHGWDGAPDEHVTGGSARDSDRRGASEESGWDGVPPYDPRSGWDSGSGEVERLYSRKGEEKSRPDWVTSPVPAAAPPVDGGWSAPDDSDPGIPEAWPAPLDITPDDDLDEPPAKRRKGGGRPGRPTGGRPPGRPVRRRKPLMLLAITITALVAGAAVVAAGSAYRLVFEGGGLSHTIAAPLDGRTKAELQLATGAAAVTVRGADLGEDLFQVSTPEDGDAIPRATIDGERTTVRLTSDSGQSPSAVEIRLNAKVTWALVFNEGATTQTVDFSGGKLSRLEMAGGATRLELTLPKPAGTVPIRLRGGLKELLLHAPSGVHTRVKVTKGATTVTLDKLNRSRVAPDTTFTPNGWAQAKVRYDVDAAQGIGTIKLDRR